MPRRAYIETYGCQMNVADSELIAGHLRRSGFEVVDSEDDADVVLLNTCAVRERAEERIFGRLGWLKSLKARRPEVVVGVAGCMAERLREKLLRRAPYVDLVIGPDAYRRLPELLAAGGSPHVDVRLDRRELYQGMALDRSPGVQGFLTIMRGCDKFCSFCVVPFVRGRERSLPPGEVLAQARQMAAAGYREITLLGQTVSSYYEAGCDFADLLTMVHDQVEGLARLRFISPYPSDFSDRLIDTLARLPRIARHVHLPVQSGSDRMLGRMRRGYTVARYRQIVERLRAAMPACALTTDVIVGYPGEQEADFQATLDLVDELRFAGAFMFRYSERAGTHSARHEPDDVPDAVKGARLQALIELQEGISRAIFEGMVGAQVEVLVEGPSKRDPARSFGRTSCFKTVILAPGQHSPGELVRCRVAAATSHTLFAEAS